MSEKIEINVNNLKKHLESLADVMTYSNISELFKAHNVNSLHDYWKKRREEIIKDMDDYFVENSSYNLQTAKNLPEYIDHINKYEFLLENYMLFSKDDARKILVRLRECEYQKIQIYGKNKDDYANMKYDFVSWLIFLDYCALFSGNNRKDLTVDESSLGHHLNKLDYLLGCLCAIESLNLSDEYSFEDLCYIVWFILFQSGFGNDFVYYVEEYISEHKKFSNTSSM